MIPRSLFYPNAPNVPIPIGINQTAPTEKMAYFLAELLVLNPGTTVLEIGTGSGYQAAVLAERCTEVSSIELPDKAEPLIQSPEWQATIPRPLRDMLATKVYLFRGDGKNGWPYPCKFDSILVTCAAGEISSAWVEQLEEGGKLVVPRRTSEVEVWVKQDGKLRLERVAGYAPFTEME